MKSGFINLDYFFLTLLACEFSPALAVVLFVFTYVLELVRLLDALYYFSRSDPLFAVRFLGQIDRALVLGWAAAFVLVCSFSLFVWKAVLPRRHAGRLWRAAVPVALLLAALFAVDQTHGFKLVGAGRYVRPGDRAVDEVLLRVPLSVTRPAPRAAVVTTDGSASEPLWQGGEIFRERENVLLVVVESMGRILNKEGSEREFALFQDRELQERYSVTEGTVPFFGSTVSGEMRELCHLRTGMYVTADTLKGHPPCLPAQYSAAGYEAAAFHGFRATMFQRSGWYPGLGFTGSSFLADMPHLPICEGAFYGICDDAVADLLRSRLQSRAAGLVPPQFLYWLTLNGHLPVNEKNAPNETCPIAADHHVCAQLAYVQNVLASVKTIVLDKKIGRTAIVVVGDHAPPFLAPEDRGRFDEKNVPFIYLRPR